MRPGSRFLRTLRCSSDSGTAGSTAVIDVIAFSIAYWLCLYRALDAHDQVVDAPRLGGHIRSAACPAAPDAGLNLSIT